ncbi:hypothetical protein CBM2623_B10076 [Cupriavidus taiwanensis]|nr:hypothetical protein CBM2588_B10270 [Cupriavidus taiwanensis]SOZ26910.1 hypothetical protein CBM2608_B10072 [Cupriavidus taiwanensis]SOZ65927.1 hypothetical protein CBM2617_B10115 [Cupriavidus taiwanensis]SOZ83600.1 hypothetical protein CBM2618_B10274 [Cupriavidus taiwanensis]SOZ86240.1 hypothetical protein CBM2622_B10273 [Cupriavidus taiwanensis]
MAQQKDEPRGRPRPASPSRASGSGRLAYRHRHTRRRCRRVRSRPVERGTPLQGHVDRFALVAHMQALIQGAGMRLGRGDRDVQHAADGLDRIAPRQQCQHFVLALGDVEQVRAGRWRFVRTGVRGELALHRRHRVVVAGIVRAGAQRHHPGIARGRRRQARRDGIRAGVPARQRLARRREAFAAGQHQPHRRIQRVGAAMLRHAAAHRLRQSGLGQRRHRRLAQDQHSLWPQPLAQLLQQGPAAGVVGRQSVDHQVGIVEPQVGIDGRQRIDVQQVAVEVCLGQQVAQTQAQEGVRLDQEDGGHGRSLIIAASPDPAKIRACLSDVPRYPAVAPPYDPPLLRGRRAAYPSDCKVALTLEIPDRPGVRVKRLCCKSLRFG